MEQLWSVAVAEGTTDCVAVENCQSVQAGVPCAEPAPVGVVRTVPVTCIAGAKQWTIGRRSASQTCAVVDVTCESGARCEPSTRDVACPPALPRDVATPEPGPAEDDRVVLSVLAEKNIEKGRAALAARKYDHARQYFQFVIDKYPDSRFVNDAKAGLQQVDAAARNGG